MARLRVKVTRKKLLCCVLYGAFCYVFFCVEVVVLRSMLKDSHLFSKGYLLRTPGCSLPLYDSYHWTVGLSLAQDVPYERTCSSQKPTVLVQQYDRLTLNASALRRNYNVSERYTTCYYREVFRNEAALEPDKTPRLGPAVPLTLGVSLSAEYVRVTCNAYGKTLFSEYFLLPQPKPLATNEAEANERSPGDDRTISVLILGLDSTSRMNFHRHMVKTGQYLKDELGAFEFLALNKVEENSFPNLIPLLTGMAGSEAENIYRRYGKFDVLPLVWKTYKLKGYTTLFMDEWQAAGTFFYPNYAGFMRVPTDYCPTSILRLMEDEGGAEIRCMGSRLKTTILVKYLADVLKLNRERPMFSFVWFSHVTHDSVNGLQLMDEPLEAFLRELSAYGILENTALLFMSDHGLRMGDIRGTEIGRYEDKNPFCFLALPNRFLADNPVAAAQLQVNQRRLITNYDLHATLIALSKLPELDTNSTEKGLSLFGPIPPERTCTDAYIPRQFCACNDASRKLNDPEVSLSFARHAVAHINALAELHFQNSCVVWQLGSVDDALILGDFAASAVQLRMQITMVPAAVFEVYGTLGNLSSSEKRVNLVLRLDKYGNQTTCLPRSRWQIICMCKSYLLNLSSTTRETLPSRLWLLALTLAAVVFAECTLLQS
ncbi:hypothetical protein HPB49_000420 [Dermacentor silvarum]|uniref:Uncharacterized protein n=1 Tax=Dermacentor silvarum TaxID=543639 RepID=A0ACB8CU13_DERSI|nr:hypothetical protein HPB49_000420 [Dermacentor silvarum]